MDLKEELKIYIDSNLVKKEPREKLSKRFWNKVFDYFGEDDVDLEGCSFGCSNASSNIKDYIDKHDQYSDFQTMLFKLIDDRNLKDSDVYNKVNLDRRLFSKIRSNKKYHPSKETIILLAIALELSEQELDILLESASYSLPKVYLILVHLILKL